MSSDGRTGYNQERIKEQEGYIQNAYNEIAQIMSEELKDRIEKRLKPHFASVLAQNTVQDFYDNVVTLFDQNVTDNFKKLIQNINAAAKSWAEKEQSKDWSDYQFSETSFKIKQDMDAKAANGDEFCDAEAESQLNGAVDDIIKDVEKELEKVAGQIDACGFIDENKAQMEWEKDEIIGTNGLKDAISKSLKSYQTGIVAAMKKVYGAHTSQVTAITGSNK